MSFLTRIQSAWGALTTRSLAVPEQWERDMFIGDNTVTKIRVNSETAMRFSAVFRCVALAQETISTLPLHVYRRLPDGGREKAVDHPVYNLLHNAPNPDMTSLTFRETLQGWTELYGRAFALINWSKAGYPTELWPVHPEAVHMKRVNGRIKYINSVTQKEIPAINILHLAGHSKDGMNSYSRIQLAREGIGLGIAAEEFGGRYFGEGTNIGGFLEHPKQLDGPAFQRLKEEMSQAYKGLKKSHGLIVLEEGMKYQKIAMPLEDAQFLQTRKFQITEIARWFGFPPHLIGDLEKATFSNIEEQSIEAVIYAWRPRCVRWEQTLLQKLFLPSERAEYYAEFDLDGLLRGNQKARYESYAMMLEKGVMCADEVRQKENLSPQPNGQGKIYTMQINMMNKAALLTNPVPAQKVGTQESKRDQAHLQFHNEQQIERRTNQANIINERRRIAKRYYKRFQKAFTAQVKEDNTRIREAINTHLSTRDQMTFLSWIKEAQEEIQSAAQERLAPVIEDLADEMWSLSLEELGEDERAQTRDFISFLNSYKSGSARRYASSLANQLSKLTRETNPAELETMLEERMQEWEEKRADKLADDEKTRQRNAFVKAAYIALGVTTLRWVSDGESCPYCTSLDGKIIDIKGSFLRKGDEYNPAGAPAPMKINSNIGHPPAHGGCDCDIWRA